ncbi:hypothetical protein CXB51_010808 [Gossypium anomalum]|uniref:Retrotransposon gag domain-containing protein n=1 Tax=Gossypium anomalum TaxID=47600 RepID=A0A8J6D2H5_9ROSI|nr:hypothetical protein CXB51_010808 [Gossypium anomalum]
MKPQGVTEDQIKLRAFSFSLADLAKEWLFYLPPGSITTWADLSRLFLNRVFPASCAVELRREIVGIRQKDAETLYDYWERFKKLCASCPQYDITEQSLLQYFYEGLKLMEMNMVDAASGGALVNMTPQQARNLISTMAANSQQFRANPEPPRRVHQLSNSTLEDKVDRIANILNSLVVEKAKTARVCGICATPEHTTDACPSLNDDTMAHLDAVPQQLQDSGNSLETLVDKLAANVIDFQQETLNFQKETKASIRELTTSIEKLSSQRKLPSQTELNLRQNANTVTLRSGKVLEPIPGKNLGRLNQCRKSKEDKEILETFRNVEINIPLLDAIRQISRYAKFLKELCTNKRKLTGNEKVSVGENVFAVLQWKMPVKCKDRLADRSIVHPEGVLEDVLVKVNGLIFPADFYVIKMEEDNTPGSSDILLG